MANVPHAFVPHPDVMSPTGAPWARAHSQLQALPKAAAPELVQVPPAMPEVVTDLASMSWQPARKRITSLPELSAFLNSDSMRRLIAFLLHINR
jgi:hypothetical protein